MQNKPMNYGYARASTDGQSVTAQVAQLRRHGAGKVFREVASGAKTDRAHFRRLLDQLDAHDVVTRLDRLARSTRDLLNTLAAITGKKACFRSLGDARADTTTAHGRLMLTVLVHRFIQLMQISSTSPPRFPGEGRDPFLPWVSAFAGVAGLVGMSDGAPLPDESCE
jgi:hypothetical protein